MEPTDSPPTLKRRATAAVVLAGVAASVAVGAAVTEIPAADAYQLPGSSWTWWRSNGNNNYTNARGDSVDWEDSHHLSGCTGMHISGDSNIYAGDSGSIYSVRINDLWQHSYTGIGFSINGAGVSASGGFGVGQWDSSAQYWKLQHYYRDDSTTGINSGVSAGWYFNIARTMHGTWKYGYQETPGDRSRNEYVC